MSLNFQVKDGLTSHFIKPFLTMHLNINNKLYESQVRKLPGIELSKDEQLLQIDLLRRQLTLKRDLLNKYRSITSFDREAQSEFQIHQH